MDRDVALLLFGVASFVFVGWPSLKRLLQWLVPAAIRCEFRAGPEAVTDSQQPEAVRKRVRQMRALDFHPLGMKREWWPLWPASQALELANPEIPSFAAVYHLGDHPLIYFYTPFLDGSVVLTADHENANLEMDGYIHAGINGGEPDELLALHRENLRRVCDQGHIPCSYCDQATRLEATRAFYAHRGTRRILRRFMRRDLVLLIFPLVVLATGLARLLMILR
ncbi:MAG TPA: hypothetical protein VL475_11030 [Planctomycetaceae bacterium]|nr:hypothetical protein [Planctomycetaceae bacterium]